ncbi:MAG: TIGR03618 family F420-dependent PPOX class oxidoreductase [Acidimicrobiales bacterium]
MANRFDPDAPGPALGAFLEERHLATLTTLRPDGSPHVVPVGFTYEPARRLARVITFEPSRKVANVRAGGGPAAGGVRASICQVDGGRWVTLEGMARVSDDADAVAEAVERYAARYRQPGARADRVVIEVSVTRIMGNVPPAAPEV